jgi:hypothetical protein
VEWVNVYDVRTDFQRVQAIQQATLTRPDVGLLPEPALFGTDEWWAAVADGRVETRTLEGLVTDVRWESMGDWPGWTFRAVHGDESRWTREGDYTLYVVGLAARITYAVVSWKPDSNLVRLGESPWHKMLIRVDLEDSDRRSTRGAPGPFREVVADTETVTLWRPTGPRELELVRDSGWKAWPARLPDQPIFYPVLNEDYATKIARDWNVPASGVGHVTRFRVLKWFLDRYEVHQVGGRTILEYWIPAEDLEELNANIVGEIEVVAEFRGDGA